MKKKYKLSSLEQVMLKNRWEEMSFEKRMENGGNFETYEEQRRKESADQRNHQLRDEFYY